MTDRTTVPDDASFRAGQAARLGYDAQAFGAFLYVPGHDKPSSKADGTPGGWCAMRKAPAGLRVGDRFPCPDCDRQIPVKAESDQETYAAGPARKYPRHSMPRPSYDPRTRTLEARLCPGSGQDIPANAYAGSELVCVACGGKMPKPAGWDAPPRDDSRGDGLTYAAGPPKFPGRSNGHRVDVAGVLWEWTGTAWVKVTNANRRVGSSGPKYAADRKIAAPGPGPAWETRYKDREDFAVDNRGSLGPRPKGFAWWPTHSMPAAPGKLGGRCRFSGRQESRSEAGKQLPCPYCGLELILEKS